MRRREVLALTASGLAATAGCLASGDTDDNTGPTDTTPSTPGTTTGTPGQESLVQSVSVDALQPGLVELGTPDSIGVFGEDDRQYLFLDVVPVAGDAPESSAFAFMLDGEAYPPVEKTRRIWRAYNADDEGAKYAPSSAGWLLFDLPATAADTSTAHLTWPDGYWQPDQSVRERLATPAPTFEVSVEVPETVPVGEPPSMTITAENTGSVAGRFLAAVNRTGPNIAYAPEAAVRTLLDPGASDQWTGETSLYNPEEITAGDRMRLTFDWLGGKTSREVEFVAA